MRPASPNPQARFPEAGPNPGPKPVAVIWRKGRANPASAAADNHAFKGTEVKFEIVEAVPGGHGWRWRCCGGGGPGAEVVECELGRGQEKVP